MDKVLLFFTTIGALTILAQWYVFQTVRTYIFQRYDPISRRSAYLVLIILGTLNFVGVRVALGYDLFAADSFGKKAAEALFFTYLGIIILLSLCFLLLDLIATLLGWKDKLASLFSSSDHPSGTVVPDERGFVGHQPTQERSNSSGKSLVDRQPALEATAAGSSELRPGLVKEDQGEPELPSPARRKFLKWSAGAAVIFATGFAGRGLAQAYGKPVIEEFDVFHAKLEGLTKPLTFIQMTDFHFGMFMGSPELERIVGMINAIEADAVFITGDLFHSPISPVEPAVPILKKLSARRIGNFAVMGNHDFYAGESRSVENITASGLTLLRNQWISLDQSGGTIHIGGIDDPLANWVWGKDFPNFKKFKDQTPNGKGMRILLSHRPSVLPLAAGAGIDFVLAGHTHGGQIIVPTPGRGRGLSIAGLVSDYTHGWYRKGSCRMYLNRGAGLTFLPWRVGCSPEIAVFHLKPPGSERWRARRSHSSEH